MLRLPIFGIVLFSAACASRPAPSGVADEPVAPPSPTLPAVVDAFADHPLWFGKSDHSPFGPMPYGLAPRREGAAIVLRGDVPPGMGLPDGSYQQFTLTPDAAHGSHLDYETSLAGELATGRMIEMERDEGATRYCMAEADGGCRAMEVVFRREAPGIRFETRRDDAPHHSVVLAPPPAR